MEILTSRSQNLHGKYFITTRERSCGKVIFSLVSVCLSVHDGGGSHAFTHDALDLTVQASSMDMELHCTGTPWQWHLVAITGDLFKPFHFGTPLPPGADIWWLLKQVRSASGQYASYWNAFLFFVPLSYLLFV